MDRTQRVEKSEEAMEAGGGIEASHRGGKPDQEFLCSHFSKARELLAKTYIIINSSGSPIPLKQLMNDIEKSIIDSALHVSRGSQKKAAEILGVKQTSLCEKMKKLNIKSHRSRTPFLIPGISDY